MDTLAAVLLSPTAALVATTFAVCVAGGLVPVINCEAWLLVVGATAPRAALPLIAVAAALGQMVAKSAIYFAGRGALGDWVGRRLSTHSLGTPRGIGAGVMLLSAFAGVPPLYATSVAAGSLRWPFAPFFALGIVGRLLRFALVLALPGAAALPPPARTILVVGLALGLGLWAMNASARRRAMCALVLVVGWAASAAASDARAVTVAPGEDVSVTTAGAGPAVVLVPGLLGSAFAYRHVTAGLVAAGHRVIVVEPLGVGMSSRPAGADYSLTAQADRIARVLDVLEVDDAVVVAHSVAASMALRLACRHPHRVRGVVSLEGGPAETVATAGFRFAMRFAPLLKLFGGRDRIRGKVRGTLESRSANPGFVTDAVVRGYTDGATRELDATLVAFTGMSRAVEPEALAPRLHEVRCPVRLLLGAFPHEGGPSAAEVQLLERELRSFVVTRLPGVGHFVYEEAPASVVAAVVALGGNKTAFAVGGVR